MKKKQLTFKMPNTLIDDGRLDYSARKVGAVLYSRRNAFGGCCKSLKILGMLSNLCVTTVHKAVQELSDAGYITITPRHRFDKKRKKWLKSANLYTCNLTFEGGYTLMPRSVFNHIDMTDSSFTVLMHIYQQAGNASRAYPSISKICKGLAMAMSTVCLGIVAIRKLSCILVQHCILENRKFTCNNYLLVTEIKKSVQSSIEMVTMSFVGAMQRLKLGLSEGQI